MLEELRISNFAIIDDLDITFSQGMSALLGETGAGKSIVVEALSLLSGKRAEFDKLKDETKKAFVEGTFVFSEAFIASHPALNDYLDGKRITVSRSLLPSRSAVSRINGETVSNSVLKNVMDGVIDIHSQGDSALLLDESSYLGLLDSYKKDDKDYQEALSSYQAAYKALNEASKEVSSFVESNDLAQKEFLSYQAKEIQEAHLAPHEIEDLNEELEANDKYEELQNAFKDLSDFYYSGENGSLVADVLNTLSSKLKPLEGTLMDKEGKKAIEGLDNLTSSLDDLFSQYQNLDFSPERLEQINARLFSLSDLQHKYGKTTQEILSHLAEVKKKLSSLDSYADSLAELKKKEESLLREASSKALTLSDMRQKAGAELSKEVNGELESLGLRQGGFNIVISPTQEMGLRGKDKASFEICMNKGGKFLPMKEAVSGGENSRLTLALKSVFNRLNPYDLMVFDEIDSGISGQVAFKAAMKMKEMASVSQIIAISHLPQVVASADNCYFVYKDSNADSTSSHIEQIEGKRTTEEIAKMISGSEMTPAAFKAALDLQKSFKAK